MIALNRKSKGLASRIPTKADLHKLPSDGFKGAHMEVGCPTFSL